MRSLAAERARRTSEGRGRKAQLHYKLGRFEEALNAYTRAYEIYHAPALLFNIVSATRFEELRARDLLFEAICAKKPIPRSGSWPKS